MSSIFTPIITEILKGIEYNLSIRIITPAPDYPGGLQLPKCMCCKDNDNTVVLFLSNKKKCSVCIGLIGKAKKFRKLNTPIRNIKMPIFESYRDEHIMNYFRERWSEFNPQIVRITYEDRPDILKKRVIRLTRDRVVMTKYAGKS